MGHLFDPELIPLWLATAVAGICAVGAVLLARGLVDPFGWLVRQVSSSHFPDSPAESSRRRVAIDARPMIGLRQADGQFATYGIGNYLIHLTKELVSQDKDTEYVLWSASWKVCFPEWYTAFVSTHHNVRAVHIRLPNHVVDLLSFWRFRFLHELVGVVDASYEANYFPIKPGNAFSICTVHDLSFRRDPTFRRARGWQEEAAARAGLADKITTVSDASRTLILDHTRNWVKNVRPENVVVVHGAPDSQFNPHFADQHLAEVRQRYDLPKLYFICSGEPVARKNFPALIQAFQTLRSSLPDYYLIMTGFDQAQLKTAVGGNLEHVRALGYVPEKHLPSLFRGAQALIYPSVDEGFGLPVVEAMSTGQVVVTSNIAALREVTGGVSITSDTDPNAIALAMSTVANMDASERRRLIERGLANSRRFTWSASAATLLRVIHEGIALKRRGRILAPAQQTKRASGGGG